MRRNFLLLFFLFIVAEAIAADTYKTYPDVSQDHIVFSYADDLWIAPRTGGTASQLTDLPGGEILPKFSADGRTIAFVSNGELGLILNRGDLYSVPLEGGKPFRITHHPAGEMLNDWTPSGELLFFGYHQSDNVRQMKLFTVNARGGLPQLLTVPYGSFGAMTPDGESIVYEPFYRDFGRFIKRDQGGLAPDLWLYNLKTKTASKITDWKGADAYPMCFGRMIYYLSDAGANRRLNVWSYDPQTQKRKQLTDLDHFDIASASIGPGKSGKGEIILQHGFSFYILDLPTNKLEQIDVIIPGVARPAEPREMDASKFVDPLQLRPSPDGSAAVIEARGDVWILPFSGQSTQNLTRSAGSAERDPSWSPDGKSIAYFSDAAGEYDLYKWNLNQNVAPQKLTNLGPGFRYLPSWSPDSQQIAFFDHTGVLFVHSLKSQTTKRIDADPMGFSPQVTWSPDSRWIAYTKRNPNYLSSLWLYDSNPGKTVRVTSGHFNDTSPVFDREGKHIYFASARDFTSPTFSALNFGDLDREYVYGDTFILIGIPLEGISVQNAYEKRMYRLALPKPGARFSFSNLSMNVDGNLIYNFCTNSGLCSIRLFDLSSKQERVLLENADEAEFGITADWKKILFRIDGTLTFADAKDGKNQKQWNRSLKSRIDPRKEWSQIFDEAWRVFRDFFYDEKMHGLNWREVRDKYRVLIPGLSTRRDLNDVINHMINELSISHAEIEGGDYDRIRSNVGMLGVDFQLRNGAYQISKIYQGEEWDLDSQSPLHRSGIHEGDYILAVNGKPLDTALDPWAGFEGTGNQSIRLLVNNRPEQEGAREITVSAINSEHNLRYKDWIKQMRIYVDRKSNGKIGYGHLLFTGMASQHDLYAQLLGQFQKDALIIDVRWNGGGKSSSPTIDFLNRTIQHYEFERGSQVRQEPWYVHRGPKCLLINHAVGSGGEDFGYRFRKNGIGKLIGTRTWGGIHGGPGFPSLIDGGGLRIPSRGMYETSGTWYIEGNGLVPDIEVVDDPDLLSRGQYPQIDAAIELLLAELKRNPVKTPPKPSGRSVKKTS